jgi:hypothetical protein
MAGFEPVADGDVSTLRADGVADQDHSGNADTAFNTTKQALCTPIVLPSNML